MTRLVGQVARPQVAATMLVAVMLGLTVGLTGCGQTDKPPAPGQQQNEPTTPDLPSPQEEQPAETPSMETPEQPKPEAPSTETSVLPETPATETPGTTAPAPETPSTEPKPEVPATEAPKPEPPAVTPAEEPAPEMPAEQPAPETPATPAPETPAELAPEAPEPPESPMSEAPKPELPSAEPAPAEQPAAEAPSAGQPAVTEPSGEQDASAGTAQPFELKEGTDLVTVPTPLFMPEPVPLADAEATSEAEMKPYTETIPGTGVKFEMVPIKGGRFLMGSPTSEADRRDDEGPQHEVEIEPFWMGKCEVTWQEYELWGLKLDKQRRQMTGAETTERDKIADAITMPTNPYTDMTFGMGKEGYPAICMTQLSAKVYCKWLSAKTGRYYRLPTEAEWEYACRAGTTTAYSFGDDPEKLGDYAWYFDNSDDKYQKVGQKKPNPWGLHDMHGNVCEWVVDGYAADSYQQFAGKTSVCPLVPATSIWSRVVRGGSWTHDPADLRSAARVASHKDWKMQDPQIPQSVWYLTDADFVGFRVIRPLRTPSAEEAKKYEPDAIEVEEYQEYKKAQAGKM